MSVKLRRRKLKSSKNKSCYSFYLDIYSNGQRETQTINHLILDENAPKEERNEIIRQAEQVARVKEGELFNEEYNMPSKNNQKIDFISYFTWLKDGKKETKTQESWNNTLNYLKLYFKGGILFNQLKEERLVGFIKYLQREGLSNNSVVTYFQKVKAALNQAVKEKKIYINPAHNIQSIKKIETEKVNLSIEELQLIMKTKFYNESVKRAFLFSCYTGLRISDIKKLQWGDIKKDGKKMAANISQQKTGEFIYQPLNETAIELMGKPKNDKEYIFNLSVHSKSINRVLDKLIKAAEIKKKITFHCARHTNAVQMVTAGIDIFVVSKMLGHRDIKSTMVYAKVANELKEKAANSIPKIKV
jgi:integrase